MGAAAFADFSVVRGMLPDFLPALEYVVADKAKRGERLRAVFLLLDIDTLVTRRYPLADINRAYEDIDTDAIGRGVIVF